MLMANGTAIIPIFSREYINWIGIEVYESCWQT